MGDKRLGMTVFHSTAVMRTWTEAVMSEGQAALLQKRLEKQTLDLDRQEIPQEDGHSGWWNSDRTLLRERTTVSDLFSSHMEDYFCFY